MAASAVGVLKIVLKIIAFYILSVLELPFLAGAGAALKGPLWLHF